jgi:hypothetical protein
MVDFGSVIEGAAVVFAVRFVAVEARLEHASRRGEMIVFRPVLIVRSAVPIAAFLLYATSQFIKTHDWLMTGVGALMTPFMFFNSLGTISVDKDSIRETRWLGLKRTRIPWGDIVFAGGDSESRITIRSKDDHVISHTAYHVDRAGFIEALRQYCPIWAKQTAG